MNPFLHGIQTLHKADARFVFAGGFAAVMHGNNRFTSDLDVIVDFEGDAPTKFLNALTEAGFLQRNDVNSALFKSKEGRDSLQKDHNLRFLTFFNPEMPTFVIDLFIEHPLPFDSLYARSSIVAIASEEARICSIDDLIAMKKISNRPQDLLDIEALELIKAQRSS